MADQTVPKSPETVWDLADRQHGVVSRRQMLDAGYSPKAILERRKRGRLHPLYAGVYAVGRPQLTQRGRWMAAVLACPLGAVLSFFSAGALWGLVRQRGSIEVSLPRGSRSRRGGIRAHRPVGLGPEDVTTRHGIPVTKPARTLVDIASQLTERQLEAAVNRADKLDLVDPERLHEYAEGLRRSPGAAALRSLLGRQSFRLTDSELERLFLRLVRRAGLPLPETQVRLNGHLVDFHWRGLDLVVETDGLRYHRTAATQARDTKRDRSHAAAGLTTLRFTHHEVRHEPRRVAAELAEVMERRAA